MSGWYHLTRFFAVVVFPAALLHTVRQVRRLQYQFIGKTRPESRTPDLPAPKRMHSPLGNRLVAKLEWIAEAADLNI